MRQNLPTQELKDYGILNEDLSFSAKISPREIENFLNGHSIVVTNGNKEGVFSLAQNNTELKVNIYEREQSLEAIKEKSQKEIVYSDVFDEENQLDYNKKVFVFDKQTKEITELDLQKHTDKITKIILEQENVQESNRFKIELLKLKGFLQDKMDKFPEIAKEIANDMSIVSKTINSIDDATPNQSQQQKQQKTDIRLNVNDPDLYQDANREREENEEMELTQEKKRSFRR